MQVSCLPDTPRGYAQLSIVSFHHRCKRFTGPAKVNDASSKIEAYTENKSINSKAHEKIISILSPEGSRRPDDSEWQAYPLHAETPTRSFLVNTQTFETTWDWDPAIGERILNGLPGLLSDAETKRKVLRRTTNSGPGNENQSMSVGRRRNGMWPLPT